RVVEEAGNASDSWSSGWWVNSGGRLISDGSNGGTIQGELPAGDRWRALYGRNNPTDTDGGLHPQNIFRLVTSGEWKELTQEVTFRIRALNLSSSPNRSASNGVLFFHRYQDGDDLYYAGVRVDGSAVIKKKLAGVYTTLASRKIYPGTYDREAMPNLLPVGRWIGMRTLTQDLPGGGVSIRLEIRDPADGGAWTPVLEADDTGAGPSGPAIDVEGHAGIRTDFLDVEFDDYSAVPACGVSLPVTRKTIAAAGGRGTFSVVVPSGCTWSAASSSRWITASETGTDGGVVTFYVRENRGDRRRSGSIHVGSETFTVRQRPARR
ncbi:MAG: hypothetical protein QOD06_2100, partial [Candidatus Binatota bacterium]|nr:hypothetical protein [Candidatus Binatota bacterium]